MGQAGRQNLNAALELDPAKAAYNQQIGTIASTFRCAFSMGFHAEQQQQQQQSLKNQHVK